MNLRFNAYSPRINEWGDDEVSRMKRKIKTLGGYDDPKVTIWIIKIGQSVDIEQNNGAENENDEKMKVVEKDEITSDHKDNDMRNVEDGDKQDAKVHEQQEEGHKVEEKSLMGMEEAFEKLKKFVLQTNVSNMDESCKESTFREFEEKYMELKRLFFPMSNVVVEERLSENDSCGDMELHVSPIVNNQCHDEKVNVDVPYVEKQEEQLSSLVVLPRQLKKTRSTMERKPSKFKVSPYIHQSNKMPKPKRFPSIVVGSQKIIPMSILPNVEDSHSLSTLESLVVAYVFDVSLDKSELLVNFQYEHASRADFLTLGPRQELLDVIINVFACKLNSFENKFKGIRPTRCYLPTTFAQIILHGGRKLATATKMFTHIIKHMDEMNDCNKIYIPMHDTCPDHWYLCVINLHQHNIHILDSLPSIERDDMRTSSVRTVVEECAHFFNLNGHLKNLSSVPIERPTWVDVQANGWDCGVHVINHMRRSDFMDSSSTPSHWDSTAIRHKLAIELLLDDENSEKAIILDKVQNHAKIKRKETCSRNSGCKVVHGDLH
ncbi:hypothetical protein CK203_034056 [Vitis vinifera]|uniref:Ubiquitin-like protease family profile domain-containing protein n=1 Tax=Vitis vinifera TaxID=29760 RepID=A0A438IBC4_VITVI|nr:hypothetical protein CK203_034056 [Vitis vinifera]